MTMSALKLDVFPSNVCDRNCAHCGFDSNTKCSAQYLPLHAAQTLQKEISGINRDIMVNITGAGEPFFHKELPHMIEIFLHTEHVTEIDITTSGQLLQDTDEIRRFNDILALGHSHRLLFRLSFNEYNPTGKKRFVETLLRLIRSPHIKKIKVANRFSTERLFSTQTQLLHCLNEVMQRLEGQTDIHQGLIDPNGGYFQRVIDSDFFSRHKWHRGIHGFAIMQTFLMNISYFLENSIYGEKEICLEPMYLHHVGRARHLNESFMGTMRLTQKSVSQREPDGVVVGYDGFYYPSYMCFYRDHIGTQSICHRSHDPLIYPAKSHATLMRLGHVGTDHLTHVLTKKDRLRRIAPETIYGKPSLDRHECQICLEQKLRLFGY